MTDSEILNELLINSDMAINYQHQELTVLIIIMLFVILNFVYKVVYRKNA